MMTPNLKSVAFTGHRTFKMQRGAPSLFDRPESPQALRERLSHLLRGLIEQGYTRFLSGMAEGFDLLAAEAVLALRVEYPNIQLVAVIPFAGQAQHFAPEVRKRYQAVLEQANQTITLSQHYSTDCFHRRNDYLVEQADLLVAYYNGTQGGTAYTVRLANRHGITVINLASA